MAKTNDNLKPVRSVDEAREKGHAGGIKSGEARREKKALRELLLDELAKDGGGGLTKAQWLVAKALENHAKGKLTFKDLKDLQDLLGESVQNINLSTEGEGLLIRFDK